MGLIDFIKGLFEGDKFRRYRTTKDGRQVERYYKKPLYRKNGQVYWKGIPIHDDEFDFLMQGSPEELLAYNFHVRKANRRVRHRTRRRKIVYRKTRWHRRR